MRDLRWVVLVILVGLVTACGGHVESEEQTRFDDLRASAGLVALYHFEEGSGTVVHDTSGFGAPLDLSIPSANAVHWGPGTLTVDSPTIVQSVDVATSRITALTSSGAFTFEAWIAPQGLPLTRPGHVGGITKGRFSTDFGLYAGEHGALSAYQMRVRTTATSNAGTPALITPNGAVAARLTHVVYVREANGTARIYVDNVAVATQTGAAAISNFSTTYRMMLAGVPDDTDPFLGTYHLVALYSRALSAAEVAQNFAQGADPGGAPGNQLPTASFTATPSSGTVPLNVAFNASSSSDPDGAIASYAWDFGDGSTGNGVTTTHTYSAPGTFTVRLTVMDGQNATAQTTRTVNVTQNEPPGGSGSRVTAQLAALYEFNQGSGNVAVDTSGVGSPLNVTIQNPGNVTWTQGGLRLNQATVLLGASNNKIISAVRASNQLTVEAWVTPTVVTTTAAGRIATISKNAFARNVSLSRVRVGTQYAYEGLLRTSTGSKNGLPVTTAAGTAPAALTHVVYTRDTAGSVAIYLNGARVQQGTLGGNLSGWAPAHPIALGAEPDGALPWLGTLHLVAFYSRALGAAEVTQNFQAGPEGGGAPPTNQAPVASFVATPSSGTAPLAVGFNAGASTDPDGTIAGYAWSFGDGQSGTGATASHTYTGAGSFVVTLTVTDDDGATATATQGVTVQTGGGSTGDVTFTRLVIDANPPLQAHAKGLGDITGDGFLDAVVAGAGNGDGGLFWYEYPTFTKYTIVPEGPVGFTTDMKFADVDNDGDSDIVIPQGEAIGASVYWYENPRPSGNPRTADWNEHFIGNAGSHDVNVEDLDGDGKIDVVVRYNAVTAFFQNTPDSWTSRVLSTASQEGSHVADVDSDGDGDVVINGVWLENPRPAGNARTAAWTSRTFASSAPTACAVRVVRVNSDSRPDIVMTSSEGSFDLSWYEAPLDPKTGTWVKHVIQQSASYNHRIHSGDVDLDGDMDLVTAQMHQSTTDEVVYWENVGGGGSWVKHIVSTAGMHNQDLADYDRDGDLDIFGANWHGQTPVELFRNDLIAGGGAGVGIGSWTRHVIDGNKPWRSIFMEPADIDRDGLQDIVVGAWWYRNPGAPAGTWTRRTIGSPLNNMAKVYDFDEDGDLDVLGTEGVGSAANHELVWAQNDGLGTFTVRGNVQSPTVGEFLQGTEVTRFVPGGPLRIILSWQSSVGGVQAVTVPANPTTTEWPLSVLSSVSGGEGVDSADIDRDGDNDVLIDYRYLRNDGATWAPVTYRAITSGEADRNFWVDLDGDGDLDVLTGYGHNSSASFAWYEQLANPATPWPEHLIAQLTDPQSVDYADMDGDGDIDVVAGEHLATGASSSLEISVYENLGNARTWRTHLVYAGDEHHDGAKLVDIDNDCDLDIISQGWTHSEVYLYENRFVTGTRSCASSP